MKKVYNWFNLREQWKKTTKYNKQNYQSEI